MDIETLVESGMIDDAYKEANEIVSLHDAYLHYADPRTHRDLDGGDCPWRECNGSSSFVVSPNKNLYHCFACGDTGDLVVFMNKLMQTDVIETVRYLLSKYRGSVKDAGVTVEKEDSGNWRDKEVIPGYKVRSFTLLKGPYFFPRKYRNFLKSYIAATKVGHNDKHEAVIECDECFSVIGKLECGLTDGLRVKIFDCDAKGKSRTVADCSCGRIIIRTDEMFYQMPEDWTT